MELRAGYKQTELGVIPEDWGINYVEEVANITTGGKNTQDRVEDGAYSFFVRSQKVERINSYSFDGEGVLTAGDGVGTGKIFHYIYGKCDIHQRVYLMHDFKKLLNGSYFYHYFAEHFYDRIMQMTAKSSVDSVRREMIARMPILLPPVKEQQAIAEALSDADALIDGLEKLIAKKRLIKQGVMQELLTGKRRLPGFSGEWQETTLFELANMSKAQFDDGDWVESEHIKDKGIRLVQTGNVGIGKFLNTSNKKYINELSFNSLRCKEIYPSDLLICRLADPAGRACILPEIDEERIITSVDITIFRPRSESADKNFLLQIFCTPEWLQNVSDKSGGTTHKRVSRGALGKLLIKMPEVAEQNALGLFFADMDVEISTLEAKLKKARQIKQGMMQELLTGRIRLI